MFSRAMIYPTTWQGISCQEHCSLTSTPDVSNENVQSLDFYSPIVINYKKMSREIHSYKMHIDINEL